MANAPILYRKGRALDREILAILEGLRALLPSNVDTMLPRYERTHPDPEEMAAQYHGSFLKRERALSILDTDQFSQIAIAYCVQARLLSQEPDLRAAWARLVSGAWWAGAATALEGALLHPKADEFAFRRRGKKGARASHAGSEKIRADAIAYYAKHLNTFTSKDNAAEVMIRKAEFPVSFRTMRGYLVGQPSPTGKRRTPKK